MPNETIGPKVSIVTPSYNQGIFLEETIQSVLTQDYPNIEYIVMDGGSTDNSVEVIKKYEKDIATWVSERDRGQADAINKGWQQSTGEIIGWINSDDIMLPGAVSCVVNYFTEHPDVGYVYGNLDILNERSEKIGTETYSDFDLLQIVKEAKWISQPGSFVRRSILEKVGLLDTSLHFQMDLDFWLRAGLICPFGYIRTSLAGFRHQSNSKSMSKTYLAGQDIQQIYRKFFSLPNLPTQILEIQNIAWAHAHLYAAQAFALSGRYPAAITELFSSIKSAPPIALKRKFWKSSGYIGWLFLKNLIRAS